MRSKKRNAEAGQGWSRQRSKLEAAAAESVDGSAVVCTLGLRGIAAAAAGAAGCRSQRAGYSEVALRKRAVDQPGNVFFA